MLGIRFDVCNEFGLSFNFDSCILNNSSFYKLKIKKTLFESCLLKEVDFSECDLQSSVFSDCDLTLAIFDHSNLEKTDFRSSFNFSIDPEQNRIKKAIFSTFGLNGLLNKYDIIIDDGARDE